MRVAIHQKELGEKAREFLRRQRASSQGEKTWIIDLQEGGGKRKKSDTDQLREKSR